MSLTDFYHGVETVTVDSGARPITTARSSVIGIVYTAPDADDTAHPLDTPQLFNRPADYAKIGATGTAKAALDAIFEQSGALVVGIRVDEGTALNDTLSNVIGGVDPSTGAYTGVSAFRAAQALTGVQPMLFIAPGFTSARPAGLKTVTPGTGGTGYTHATAVLTGGGATVQGELTAVITGGAITGWTIAKNGFGYTGVPDVAVTGDGTGAGAPTLTVGPFANPVVGAFLALADDFKAHILADCPATTDADALAYRNDFGSRRVYVIEPAVSIYSTTDSEYVSVPASAAVAGLISRVDDEVGFWESPSNKELYGVGGISRPVDYQFGSKNSRANILNSTEIATIINDDGWRLWGNRTCSADPKYAFLSISRTCDLIDISIAQAHKWAVDKGITKSYFSDVVAGVNAYLRSLQKRGAIVGGTCWVDPEDNPATEIENGHVTFSYKFSGVYPAERLTFKSQLTDEFLPTLFS